MMDDTALREWATEEVAKRQVAQLEGEIANLMASRRHAEERQAIHERLCGRHGLRPELTSPRALARAERLYAAAWGSFVMSRYGGAPTGLHILHPESSGIEDKTRIAELTALRDSLRKRFDASWPPANFAALVEATDGTEQLHAHNATRAA